MKNRLFPIIIALCFVSLVGVAFLRTPSPKVGAPVETESVQESIKPIDMPENNEANPLTETDAFSQAFGSDADVDKLKETLSQTFGSDVDMDKLKEALRSKDPERIKEAMGPEFAARMDAAMKYMEEKMEGLEEGEFPDFNIQEYMNIFMGENGPKIDFAEISQQAFRRHFPEGEPEDYEVEMAKRIHEIVAATPGNFQEVMAAVTMNFAREQDFQFWALANFKGEIGQQMDWMTQQILVGGELENIQYDVPEDLSTFTQMLTEVNPQDSAAASTSTPQTATDTTEPIESRPVDPNGSAPDVAAGSEIDPPTPMSTARINSIKEILSQHGTDEGLLQLLETDTEGANWLLERFDSPDQIETWLSEQSTEAPPKPNLRQLAPQSLPLEVQP